MHSVIIFGRISSLLILSTCLTREAKKTSQHARIFTLQFLLPCFQLLIYQVYLLLLVQWAVLRNNNFQRLLRILMNNRLQQQPTLIRALKGHKQSVIALDLYPSCKYIASAGMDNIIFLWDLTKRVAPVKLVGHKSQIHDIKFSPAGNIIVSASNDESLKFWDIDYQNSKKQTTLFKAHNARIRGLSFSCDGLLLSSCGDDKLIKVWSTVDRRLQYTLKKHTNWVRHCQFSPTATNLASCDDKSVFIWDVNTKKHIQTYSQHSGVIHRVKFHSLGNCMATGSHDTKIKLYDLRSQSVIQVYQGHTGPVRSIDFHPHSAYLISSSDDGTTKIWNSRKGQLQYTIQCHSNNTRFSRQGEYFITGGSQKIIYIWKTGFYDRLNQKIIEGVEKNNLQSKKKVIPFVQKRQSSKLMANLTESSTQDKKTSKILPSSQTNYNNFMTNPILKEFQTGLDIKQQQKLPQVHYNHAEQCFQTQLPKNQTPQKNSRNFNNPQSPSTKQVGEFQIPEKLMKKIRRISNQLDFIIKTTQILEARVGNNGQQLKRLVQLNNSFKTNTQY